jgi:hypothetical protein
MKVTRDRIEGKLIAIVISGDVITGAEFELLREFSKKHNGVKNLWFPKTSLLKPGAGLKALKALKTYKRYFTNFLFLVDREHFKTQEEKEEIEDTIKGFGINVISLLPLSKGSFILEVEIGDCKATLHIVIFGETKKLEEEITKLIERTLKEKVQPEKNEIKEIYKKHKTSLEKLVKNANSKDLNEAFPNLTLILKKISSKDC